MQELFDADIWNDNPDAKSNLIYWLKYSKTLHSAGRYLLKILDS
jgi:hypothetical protein